MDRFDTRHGIDGWTLAEYEAGESMDVFVYERRLRGAAPESLTIHRPHTKRVRRVS